MSFSSNYGAGIVDIAAQGSEIKSTCMDGGTLHSSGTSIAAPIVSGQLALLRSQHPKWTAQETLDYFFKEEAKADPSLKDKITGGRVLSCKERIVKPSEIDFIEY
jgi:subtilisin family serine protease